MPYERRLRKVGGGEASERKNRTSWIFFMYRGQRRIDPRRRRRRGSSQAERERYRDNDRDVRERPNAPMYTTPDMYRHSDGQTSCRRSALSQALKLETGFMLCRIILCRIICAASFCSSSSLHDQAGVSREAFAVFMQPEWGESMDVPRRGRLKERSRDGRSPSPRACRTINSYLSFSFSVSF